MPYEGAQKGSDLVKKREEPGRRDGGRKEKLSLKTTPGFTSIGKNGFPGNHKGETRSQGGSARAPEKASILTKRALLRGESELSEESTIELRA